MELGSSRTGSWLAIVVVVALSQAGCQCRRDPGCLDGQDCPSGAVCCIQLGSTPPGFCTEANACGPASCTDDFDCTPETSCCPDAEGRNVCTIPRSGEGTVCGACRTDTDCGSSAVCCPGAMGTVCVQGITCDSGADAGTDPPSHPVDTSAAPEEGDEATVESSTASGQGAPISMAIIPGTNEITIHNLLTGQVLQELMSSPSNTGAFVIRDGSQPFLLSIGGDGATVRGWSGTEWRLFGQVLFLSGPTNITDAAKVLQGGVATAAILTDNTNGRINYLTYDSGQSLWGLSRTTNIPIENGARAVSAVAPVGDSPVLVAVDGMPGRLWWVDWSVTPATLLDLGTLGDSPRRMNCSADGARCFIPNFGSGTVTVVDTSGATPVVLPAVVVGSGPVSVSVATRGGTIVAVTSGFNDNSLTYLVMETAGVRTVSETLTNCTNPGHAVWLPDLGRVMVTCNADDTYLIHTPPATVP